MTLFCRFPQTFETALQRDGHLSPTTAKPDLKTEAGGTVSSTSASDV